MVDDGFGSAYDRPGHGGSGGQDPRPRPPGCPSTRCRSQTVRRRHRDPRKSPADPHVNLPLPHPSQPRRRGVRGGVCPGRTHPGHGGADQTVRLRVVSDHDRPHQLGQPLTGHTGAINGVAFAPDGRTLATTSTDQTAILWDVPRFGRFRAVRCKKLASAPVDRSIRQRGPSTPPRSVTRTPALIVDQAGSAVRGRPPTVRRLRWCPWSTPCSAAYHSPTGIPLSATVSW